MTTARSPASKDAAQVFGNLADASTTRLTDPAGEKPALTATRWHAGESWPTTAPRRYRWSFPAARRSWFAWANTIGSRAAYTRRDSGASRCATSCTLSSLGMPVPMSGNCLSASPRQVPHDPAQDRPVGARVGPRRARRRPGRRRTRLCRWALESNGAAFDAESKTDAGKRSVVIPLHFMPTRAASACWWPNAACPASHPAAGQTELKAGLHDSAEVFFDDVRVPAANPLGREGGGFAHLVVRRPPERLPIAMMALAPVRAALDRRLPHPPDRVRPPPGHVPEHPVRAGRLGDRSPRAGGPPGQSGPGADRGHADRGRRSPGQALGRRGQRRVLDRCLQLPGGYGYMTEYPIARRYADARVQTMCGGTSEIMKAIIARDVTGLRT